MASGVYNRGAFKIQDRTVDWVSDTIKIMLVTSSYTFDKDHNDIGDINANELSVSGYTGGFGGAGRKSLANKTITEDTTNDRVKFDADDPTAWTLATGATVGGAVILKEVTNDAASIPIFFLDFTDTPTNGGTFTVSFHADGIAYLSQ